MIYSKVQIIGKSHILTIKNNDNWTFLIFLVFINAFPSELQTRLLRLILDLHRWAVAGQENELCTK